MINIPPDGTTRRIGKSQGYLGLAIRDDVTDDGTPVMVTRWQPTPTELAALAAGDPITLMILGRQHPPVLLAVGKEATP